MMFSEKIKGTVAQAFRLSSPKGQFGIEIETEGVDLPQGKITKTFEGKPDGSLRHGMEYISKVISHEAVEPSVNDLQEALNKYGANIRPSYRSSTHIHMNYCDKSFQDVLGMMVLWSIVEPVVFRQMEGREGSLFCVSSYDSGELPQFIDLFCKDIASNFNLRGFQPRGKYSSLNISRLGPNEYAALGSLEFRVFPTTLDGSRIKTWCNWLVNMARIVREQEDGSFLDMVSWAEQNPHALLTGIFGELPLNTPRHMAADLIDYGARTAYEMARVIKKHLSEKEKPERKGLDVKARRLPDMDRVIIIDDILDGPVQEEVGPDQAAHPFPLAVQRIRAGFVARELERAARRRAAE